MKLLYPLHSWQKITIFKWNSFFIWTLSGLIFGVSKWKNVPIELLNNKSHGLLPLGGFSFISFDQVVPYYSQRHLADQNAIYILHR